MERFWPALGALALLVLWWTCRRAPLGVPAADDYDYLYWLRFHRPLDFFDSMGALFYWRPLGRQTYYAVLDPVLFTRPWIAAAVHALLLLGIFAVVYRVARRALPGPIAAAAAVFPILAEPTRTLLVWPTGGEYLLAMLASALAVHEALADRWGSAALASLAALLSHEAAVLVLIALPAVAWARTRSVRQALRWSAVAAGVALVWLGGHAIAHQHGTGWLARGAPAGGGGLPLASWAAVLGRGIVTQLNLEELSGPARRLFALGYVALATVAAFLALRSRPARWRLRTGGPGLLGGAAWFLVGSVPLALLLPDWNSWRTPFPALWLGVALLGGLGLVRPWLAGAFLLLRTAALLLAPTASTLVSFEPPASASSMSFVRVARLQRAADATRRALVGRFPTLPRGAAVCYWARLGTMEIAIVAPKGVRVWYGDSTIAWDWLWRPGGLTARHDAVLGYDPGLQQPATVIEPRALDLVRDALSATDRGLLRNGDSLFVEGLRVQSVRPSYQFALWVALNRVRIAYAMGDYARADTLNQARYELVGGTPEYYGMAALLALRKHDRDAAARAVGLCLRLDPHNAYGLEAARTLASLARAGPGIDSRRRP